MIDTESRVITRTIEALKAGKPYILHQGGTSSGKTFGILYSLLYYSMKYCKPGMIGSVVAENLPHLKRGAITDFKNILNELNISEQIDENKSEHTFFLPNKKKIEFFATDNEQKAKSGKRDWLFLNEANGIHFSIANQLMIRTKGSIICDWNPSGKFWLHRTLLPALKEKDYVFTRTTFRDNTSIDQSVIAGIQRLKDIDPNLYDIYGEGIEGKGTEIIYPSWDLIDAFPETTKVSVGVDFGYTNDPAAGVRCALHDGSLWFDELFYQRGLSNKKIYNIFDTIPFDYGIIIADSAEPKSIDELKSYGLNIKGAMKGPDSVKYGIDQIKSYPMKVTKRSINLIDELDSYKYIMIDGKPSNKPVQGNDHCLDAARYGVQGILNKAEPIRAMVRKASSLGFTDMGL